MTGAYFGLQTKREAVEKFVETSLEEKGNQYLLCGDLNSRHCAWDTRCNERGVAIHNVVIRVPRSYICAAKTNSYHKKDDKSKTRYTKVRLVNISNPDVDISTVADTTAIVQPKDVPGES